MRIRPTLQAALLLAAVVLAPATTPSAAQMMSFDRLSRQQGLSQVSINFIHQDRSGYMWFGTQDGLNRWDGYEFVVYKHDPADPGTLSQSLAIGLHEDRDGHLWVIPAQPGAIDRYLPEADIFLRLHHDPDDPQSLVAAAVNPNAFVDDGAGSIWLGTFGGGINKIDKATGEVVRLIYADDDAESLSNDNISSILLDAQGDLWVGTFGGGLNRRLPPAADGRERFATYRHDSDSSGSLSHDVVTALFEDDLGVLWIGTGAAGVNRYDPGSDSFQAFSTVAGQPGHGPTGGVAVANAGLQPLARDGDGDLWIVGLSGISRLEPDSGALHTYLNDPARSDSLSNNGVGALLVDRTGTVWIGTQGGGIDIYNPDTDGFSVERTDSARPNSLSSNFVTSIYEGRSGRLWFGSNDGGLSAYSRTRHKFKHYARSPDNGLVDNMIFSVLEDRRHELWVGTLSGGLHHMDAQRHRTLERYSLAPGSSRDLGNNFVRAIHEDRRGRIWAGTVGGGLALIDPVRGIVVHRYVNIPGDPDSLSNNNVFGIHEDRNGLLSVATANGWNRFDPDSGRFTVYRNDPENSASLVNNFVRFTYEDRDGGLWLGTGQGLSRFDPASGRFTNYQNDLNDLSSLSQNNVMDVHQTEDGIVWIATYGGGLDRFDPASGEFRSYTIHDGLPNDSIYSLVPDESGHLWISSNLGLTRFDPKTETFLNFDADDGLQSNEFNGRAFSKSRSGEMFFGGTNGFNSFVPSEIAANSYLPPVFITRLRKYGEVVDLGRPLRAQEKIELAYQDDYISLEFVALDFDNPTRTRYAYKLDGFDRRWIQAGNQRVAHYTHLPGGRYVFRVRGSNGDGVWNDTGASLEVLVHAPPWKTWWAYTLYALVLIGGIVAIARRKTRLHQAELLRHRQDAENRRKTVELEQARKIQLSLLPTEPPDLDYLDISPFMATATEVGGDYYDFSVQPDGSLFATIGDATGHGIPAGMMVAMTKAALRALEVAAPEVLLDHLNRILRTVYPDRMMMALNIVLIRPDGFSISSAGMPPALVFRAAERSVEEILVSGLPLGSLEKAVYVSRQVKLSPDDVLVLLSDGLPEAVDAQGRTLGYDAVSACLLEHGHESARRIQEVLVDLERLWVGSHPHHDDLTLLVFKRTQRKT